MKKKKESEISQLESVFAASAEDDNYIRANGIIDKFSNLIVADIPKVSTNILYDKYKNRVGGTICLSFDTEQKAGYDYVIQKLKEYFGTYAYVNDWTNYFKHKYENSSKLDTAVEPLVKSQPTEIKEENKSNKKELFCFKCGYKLMPESTFCSRCGQNLNEPAKENTYTHNNITQTYTDKDEISIDMLNSESDISLSAGTKHKTKKVFFFIVLLLIMLGGIYYALQTEMVRTNQSAVQTYYINDNRLGSTYKEVIKYLKHAHIEYDIGYSYDYNGTLIKAKYIAEEGFNGPLNFYFNSEELLEKVEYSFQVTNGYANIERVAEWVRRMYGAKEYVKSGIDSYVVYGSDGERAVISKEKLRHPYSYTVTITNMMFQ